MWASLELQVVNGRGPVTPRLQFVFTARPVEYARVILRDVTLRVEHRRELIGEHRAVQLEIIHANTQVVFEPVTSHRALQWVTDSLVASSTSVQLDATLQGVAAFAMDLDAPTTYQRQRLINDPEPGQWKDFLVSSSYARPLLLPRADWYAQVLAPTRNEQYRYLEVLLPRGDDPLHQEWANSLSHLDEAERAYAAGDDVAVFSRLRASLDALPGAKKAILDGIADEEKRQRLDELLKRAGEFLHSGRHVSSTG